MPTALIDKYDIYRAVNYWAETMQDDCYLIATDGWKATTHPVIETKKNKDGKVIKEVVKGWACDLVPKSLGGCRYFAKEQARSINSALTAGNDQHQRPT